MKSVPLDILAVLAIALVPTTLIWVARDALQYHEIIEAEYKTPWYSASWLEQPYTNLRLALHPAREYWTLNAIQSERWLVREISIGSVVFWTVLQRVPAKEFVRG